MMDSDFGSVAIKAALIIAGMLLTVVGMGAAVYFGVSMLTSGSLFGGGILLPLIV